MFCLIQCSCFSVEDNESNNIKYRMRRNRKENTELSDTTPFIDHSGMNKPILRTTREEGDVYDAQDRSQNEEDPQMNSRRDQVVLLDSRWGSAAGNHKFLERCCLNNINMMFLLLRNVLKVDKIRFHVTASKLSIRLRKHSWTTESSTEFLRCCYIVLSEHRKSSACDEPAGRLILLAPHLTHTKTVIELINRTNKTCSITLDQNF